MLAILRKIHTYAGLQATVALLVFGVTVVTLPFAEKAPESTVSARFEGHPNGDDLHIARALHRQFGHRFEAVPRRWMVSESKPGVVTLKTKSPSAVRRLTVNRDSGEVLIETRRLSLPEFVNHLHQESIGRRRWTDSPWLWAWSLYLEVSLITLFILPVTGLYLWMNGRSFSRKWSKTILAISSMAMILLWNVMR